MSYFQMVVGKQFTIVATSGAENGRRPALKSEATGFDVFDRLASRTVCRDQPFDAAFDFCTKRLAVTVPEPAH